jgi:hypothetical protein
VTLFLAPELLDGSPLVAELFLAALGGDGIARRELTHLALTEALAAVALDLVSELRDRDESAQVDDRHREE